jgi:hypothetical protein
MGTLRAAALTVMVAGCAGTQSYPSHQDGATPDSRGPQDGWAAREGLRFPDALSDVQPDAPDGGGTPDLYPKGDLGNLNQILLVALDQAFAGNLGGVTGADARCQAAAKASSQPGVFRAFLSDSGQHVKDLVGGPNAALPVVNTKGQVMFKSWTAISTGGGWIGGVPLYTFSGTAVDDNTGAWSDADIWTGSKKDGTLYTGRSCQDWTSASGSDNGQNGEADQEELLRDESNDCDHTLAVVCVRLVP